MKNLCMGILLFSMMLLSTAEAKELPPQWPWHGVSIEGINFPPDRLAEIVKEISINSVQLRLRPRKLAKVKNISPKLAWQESLLWGDQMLDECKKLGLVTIVTVEGFPINPNASYNQLSEKFWNNSSDLDEVVRLASEMSKYYAHHGDELVAYQLMSEPTIVYDVLSLWKKAVRPSGWDYLSQRIIRSIRKNDMKRWIAFAPGPWGGSGAYESMQPLKFERIVYGAHIYTPHAFTHQGIRQWKTRYAYPGDIAGKAWNKKALIDSMQELLDFQKRYDVPVWIGEFSAIRWARGGEQYIKDLVSTFNDNGWSWTYFSMNGWHGWMPDYNQQYGMKSNTVEDRQKLEAQKAGYASQRWKTLKFIFRDMKK